MAAIAANTDANPITISVGEESFEIKLIKGTNTSKILGIRTCENGDRKTYTVIESSPADTESDKKYILDKTQKKTAEAVLKTFNELKLAATENKLVVVLATPIRFEILE